MREQGVIGNIQPSFVITDSVYIRKRLAKHVLPFSYCWKTMIEKGVVCAGGSDAPIETCNPFQGIYDAIYRCKPDKIENVFLPNECLTFEEALKIYSVNGAYAAMQESHLGEISPGFLADFVVLHHDIVKDHTKLLAKDLVRSVYVGGIQRYEAQRNSDGMSTSSDFSNSTLPGKNGRVRVCHCCSLPVPTQL
jgi:predicted amidohydrolase YtcJ